MFTTSLPTFEFRSTLRRDADFLRVNAQIATMIAGY